MQKILVHLFVLFLFEVMKFEQATFAGHRLWLDTDKKQCENGPTVNASFCFIRFKMGLFQWTKFELVNNRPLLLIIHELISKREQGELTKLANERQLASTLVMQEEKSTKSMEHESRQANGTWIGHDEDEALTKVFRRAQRITGFDLNFAEDWQLISYTEGGHYVPHYDYLNRLKLAHIGNRMATLLTIVTEADRGGGTVFPKLDLVLRPKAGDALLWFNSNVEGRRESRSLHGGCPVWKGVKLAVILWIRERGQELRVKCPSTTLAGSFDLTSFVHL